MKKTSKQSRTMNQKKTYLDEKTYLKLQIKLLTLISLKNSKKLPLLI